MEAWEKQIEKQKEQITRETLPYIFSVQKEPKSSGVNPIITEPMLIERIEHTPKQKQVIQSTPQTQTQTQDYTPLLMIGLLAGGGYIVYKEVIKKK
jgi:hypothetical protein